MSKKLTSTLLAFSLISFTGMVKAGELSLPQEVSEEVFNFLPAKDLLHLRQVSKDFQMRVDEYQKTLPEILALSTLRPSEVSLSSLASYQSDAVLKLSPSLRNVLIDEINTTIGQDNQCAFLLQDSVLNSVMQKALTGPQKSHVLLPGYTLYQLYKNSFAPQLFVNEEEDSYKKAIMQHLLSCLALYVPKENQQEALSSFWNVNKKQLMSYFKKIFDKNQYLQFSNFLVSEQKPHHLIITDTQLAEKQNFQMLTTLLEKNPNHKVVVDVGQVFVQKGKLSLTINQIPANLAHLVITNTAENVTSIGDGFLYGAENLKSFNTSRLTNVTSIGIRFLGNATNLKSFDTSRLTNVTSIGDNFLASATNLESFDTSGLTNVTSIGNYFLLNATGLKSFNTSGLTNVTSIRDAFLAGAINLKYFNTSGLINVASIGDDFLANATNLGSFDTSGLINVTSIGDDFLAKATNLKSFDTSGLTNVTSIGRSFLYGATNLESFNTSGLTKVKSVAEGFLGMVRNLALRLEIRKILDKNNKNEFAF